MPELSTVSDAPGLTASGRIEMTGGAAETDSQLEKTVDAARNAVGMRKSIFGGLTLVCLIVAIGAWPLQMHLVTALFGLVTVVSLVQFAKSASRKFDPDRQASARQILDVVKRDMAEDAPLTTMVNFLSPIAKEHVTKVGVTQKIYADAWLSLRGKFADNTKFLITVKEITVVKNRKLKVKPKGFVINLILVFSEKRYPGVGQFAKQARGSLQMPPQTQLKSIRVSDGSFRLSVKLPPTALKMKHRANGPNLLTDTVTMMLLSAYQVINLADAIKKPG